MLKIDKEVIARFHLLNDFHEGDFSLAPALLHGKQVAVMLWQDDGAFYPIAIIPTDADIEALEFPNAKLEKND